MFAGQLFSMQSPEVRSQEELNKKFINLGNKQDWFTAATDFLNLHDQLLKSIENLVTRSNKLYNDVRNCLSAGYTIKNDYQNGFAISLRPDTSIFTQNLSNVEKKDYLDLPSTPSDLFCKDEIFSFLVKNMVDNTFKINIPKVYETSNNTFVKKILSFITSKKNLGLNYSEFRMLNYNTTLLFDNVLSLYKRFLRTIEQSFLDKITFDKNIKQNYDAKVIEAYFTDFQKLVSEGLRTDLEKLTSYVFCGNITSLDKSLTRLNQFLKLYESVKIHLDEAYKFSSSQISLIGKSHTLMEDDCINLALTNSDTNNKKDYLTQLSALCSFIFFQEKFYSTAKKFVVCSDLLLQLGARMNSNCVDRFVLEKTFTLCSKLKSNNISDLKYESILEMFPKLEHACTDYTKDALRTLKNTYIDIIQEQRESLLGLVFWIISIKSFNETGNHVKFINTLKLKKTYLERFYNNLMISSKKFPFRTGDYNLLLQISYNDFKNLYSDLISDLKLYEKSRDRFSNLYRTVYTILKSQKNNELKELKLNVLADGLVKGSDKFELLIRKVFLSLITIFKGISIESNSEFAKGIECCLMDYFVSLPKFLPFQNDLFKKITCYDVTRYDGTSYDLEKSVTMEKAKPIVINNVKPKNFKNYTGDLYEKITNCVENKSLYLPEKEVPAEEQSDSISEETDSYIKFFCPYAKKAVLFYKVPQDTSVKIGKFNLKNRILKWIISGAENNKKIRDEYAHKNIKFNFYKNYILCKTETDKTIIKNKSKLIVIHHKIALDEFSNNIRKLGITWEWTKNNVANTSVSIPGEIIHNNGLVEYGMFTMTFDNKENNCYHYGFTDHTAISTRPVIHKFWEGFNNLHPGCKLKKN